MWQLGKPAGEEQPRQLRQLGQLGCCTACTPSRHGQFGPADLRCMSARAQWHALHLSHASPASRCLLLPPSCRPAKQERLIIACLGAMLAARAWRRLSIDHLMGTATTYIKVKCRANARCIGVYNLQCCLPTP